MTERGRSAGNDEEIIVMFGLEPDILFWIA